MIGLSLTNPLCELVGQKINISSLLNPEYKSQTLCQKQFGKLPGPRNGEIEIRWPMFHKKLFKYGRQVSRDVTRGCNSQTGETTHVVVPGHRYLYGMYTFPHCAKACIGLVVFGLLNEVDEVLLISGIL
jgi:hypothetical protein